MELNCKECSSKYVVNKKYQLCDSCNYVRIHGETQFQAASRKQKEKETGEIEDRTLFCINHPQRVVVNRTYKLCTDCNSKRLDSLRTPIIRVDKDIKKETKTLETDKDDKIFREIWKERPRVSEVSGKPLGDFYSRVYFSHILTKGAYGRMRREKENIKLVTLEEHNLWEFSDRDELRKKEEWRWVFEKEQELIEKYYSK